MAASCCLAYRVSARGLVGQGGGLGLRQDGQGQAAQDQVREQGGERGVTVMRAWQPGRSVGMWHEVVGMTPQQLT